MYKMRDYVVGQPTHDTPSCRESRCPCIRSTFFSPKTLETINQSQRALTYQRVIRRLTLKTLTILLCGFTLLLNPLYPIFAQTFEECNPLCRSGYMCSNGQCISECNPPCEAGLVCRGGDCHPPQQTLQTPTDTNQDVTQPHGSLFVGPTMPADVVPPRPVSEGTGGIIAGWIMFGVGVPTAVWAWLTYAEAEDLGLDSTFYGVVGVVGSVAGLVGMSVAIGSHGSKDRSRKAIREWDEKYGNQRSGLQNISVSPFFTSEGGGIGFRAEFF